MERNENMTREEEKMAMNENDIRFGLDDSKVSTKLLDKNFSPMI